MQSKGHWAMGVNEVKEYLKEKGANERVIEFGESSATVALAAKAAGVREGQIAKTLAFQADEKCVLICAAGDAKVDNKKFKRAFGCKAKMLAPEEVRQKTGYPVGGVCPFLNPPGVSVYIDQSLNAYESVYPAAGSANSAVKLTVRRLFELSCAEGFVDVCKIPESIGNA